MKKNPLFFILCLLLVFASCKKESTTNTLQAIPYYDEIPTITVENYINRLFIDLIGREPLDAEMSTYVKYLRDSDLSQGKRDSLIFILQTDTSFREGDISYHYAYHVWFYQQMLVEVLDQFASNALIQEKIGIVEGDVLRDSLNNNQTSYAKNKSKLTKLQNVINSEQNYREHTIGFSEMLGYMINNLLYDEVNMNTFNFVNASFYDLFFRYPSQSEFTISYQIIESNQKKKLHGTELANKDEYIEYMRKSRECYNGMIVRTFNKLVLRDPTSAETAAAMNTLYFDNDLKKIQRKIMVSDEYAQFKPRY